MKLLYQVKTTDKGMDTDQHEEMGKLPHVYCEVDGTLLLCILFTYHATFYSHIRNIEGKKYQFC